MEDFKCAFGLNTKELININKFYSHVNRTNNHYVSVHTTFLEIKLKLEVDEENMKDLTLTIYWTSKFHEHPSTARLAIAAS